MSTVTDVLTTARGVYLNDPSANKYTDAVMLPHAKTAYEFLQTELQSNGLQVISEEAVKTITAGDTEWSPLPNDLMIPVYAEERQAGTTDEYRPMRLMYNIFRTTAVAYLEEWAWRGDRILFKEATQDRQVRLHYRRSFPVLNTVGDQVFGKAEAYLAAKIAALALLFIDQSTTLAQVANEVAEKELAEVVNLSTKAKQAIPVRRKPYLPFKLR